MQSVAPLRSNRMAKDSSSEPPEGAPKRRRMVRPYPLHTLEEALDIAVAIQESNAGLPFDRVLLAGTVGTTPASSGYTMKLNSSAKYGLTEGAYNDERISMTARGEAIVAPKGGDELRRAVVEAAMQPEVFRRFYEMLDGKRLPEDAFAQNTLHRDLGVHPDLADECLRIIKANGLRAGIIRDIGGSLTVDLQEMGRLRAGPVQRQDTTASAASGEAPLPGGRIFLGECGGSEALGFVKSLLDDFGLPYRTAEANGGDAHPVPAAVSEAMRDCMAAILVLGGTDATERSRLVEQALYQVGAASVLYGDRIVVLTEEGFDQAYEPAGVRRVDFDRDSPAVAGLALLRELHEAGVIRVTV